ncbi:MAG: PAS domain S-box protein [Pirellulales bacterium]|nr:PAS domain S-box protein [Pirellulales bacterium]
MDDGIHRRDEGLASWLLPTLVAWLLTFVAFGFVWAEHDRETRAQLEMLRNDLAWVHNTLVDGLEAHEAFVDIVADRILDLGDGAPGLVAQCEKYVQAHPALLRLQWHDAQGLRRRIVPQQGSESLLDRPLESAVALAAMRQSQQSRMATFSPIVGLATGETGFYLFRPVFRGEELHGTLAAIFSLNTQIADTVPSSTLDRRGLRFVQGNEVVFQTAAAVAPPNIFGLSLRDAGLPSEVLIVDRQPSSTGLSNGQWGTIAVLSMGAGLVTWMAQRATTLRRQHLRTLRVNFAAVEQSHEAVLITRRRPHQDGAAIDYLNPAFTALTGFTAQDLDGRPLRDLARSLGQEFLAAAQRALATGRGAYCEITGTRKDGAPLLADASVSPVRVAGTNVTHLIVSLRDIRSRRAAEAALRQAGERIRDLYDQAPCGYHSLDENGTIVEINRTALEWLGYSRDEVVGRMHISQIAAEPAERVRERFERMKQQGYLKDVEIDLRRRDGTTFPALLNVAATYNDQGKFVMTRSTYVDLSERKAAEMKLRQSDRLVALGTLAAGIAHEINNPVGTIQLAAELALGASNELIETPRLQQALEQIVQDAKRCGRIVRGLLRFAREGNLQPRPAECNELVRSAVGLVREYGASRGVLIVAELAENLPPVRVQETEMEQVLVNLLRNAIEASPRESQVTVRTRADKDAVVLAVCDRGRGMNDEQRNRIFDPFYSTRSHEGGTGLGLSLVHGIVLAHGGSIGVQSAPGEGTTIEVCLPREMEHDTGTQPEGSK